MITLTAPIELKSRRDFVRDRESFYERVMANYSLAGLEIGSEELLHMVSSPPEIYIAEGGASTIVGNTLIQSRNEEKLEVINNLLNRIMLSVTSPLTYQDRAYITDALYKIGIKDDRMFMSEVKRMIDESRIQQEFIDEYLEMNYEGEGAATDSRILEISRQVVREEGRELLRERENYLAMNIMRRLKTGAIYQIVANFNKSLTDIRMELAEQMVSEQEDAARGMLVRSILETLEHEGAETVYRTDYIPGEEEADMPREEGGSAGTAAAPESGIAKTPVSERETIIRERLEGRDTYTETIEGADIVYRTQEEGAPRTAEAQTEIPDTRVNNNYMSSNLFERVMMSNNMDNISVREYITSAVFLDIVKNIYHAGYERINKGDTWIEYRGALYRSQENTVNRIRNVNTENYESLSYQDDSYGYETAMNLDYREFSELYEIEDNENNIALIENQIREMNEQNLKNMDRYEQMINVLKDLKPERKKSGGKEMTRRESLAALEDDNAVRRMLAQGPEAEEDEHSRVFREITRLFPDSAAAVFNVVEQYLNDPSAVKGVDVLTNNISQAAREIMLMQRANEASGSEAEAAASPHEEEELFLKREERISAEDIDEILDTYRRSDRRNVRERNLATEETEYITNQSASVTQNTEYRLSERELENIEDMVNRGVRSQMGAISDQVLTKLEKRLRNEKSRRGI